MSAETYKDYQEHQENINYLLKEFGEEGFWDLMEKASKLKSQGVDIVKVIEDGVKKWDAENPQTL